MLAADDTTKRCTKCGETKARTEFNACSRNHDGCQSHCKDCRRRYRAENRDKIRAQQHAHYIANSEHIRSRVREYAAANRDAVRAYRQRYSQANSARIVARVRAWREANPGRRNEWWRRWYAANNVEARAKWRKYASDNRDAIRARSRDWKRRNPDKVRMDDLRRRATKAAAPAIEHISRAAIWERDSGICHLCRKPCDPKRWHLDHLIPLSKGGSHTAANVAVSHPWCNMSRGNRGPAQLRLIA